MARYSGYRHDPQSLLCLASSLSVGSVDGGRWLGRYMTTECVRIRVYIN